MVDIWSLLDRMLRDPDCAVCGGPSPGAAICAPCRHELQPPPACRRCAAPLERPGLCGACLKAPPPWLEAVAAALYLPPLSGMIAALKHRGRIDLARPLGQLLAERTADLAERADVIVPVPLHRSRFSERGYNQAVELGRALATPERPLTDLLVRVRATPPQQGSSAAERRRNLRGAFRAKGRGEGSVLLVDDVLTTGATLRSATRALMRAGWREVRVAVLARA